MRQMNKPPMAQYIADGRAKGKSDSNITHELLDAGWHMDVIAKAMHSEPIKHRSLDPILDIKKQPIKKTAVVIPALLLLFIMLLAAFA